MLSEKLLRMPDVLQTSADPSDQLQPQPQVLLHSLAVQGQVGGVTCPASPT